MNRQACVVGLLLLAGGAGAAAQKVQNEGLVRALGPGWTSMYEISPDLRYDAIELVPNGSTLRDYKEVVRISDFLGASNDSAEDLLKQHQTVFEKHCPGTMHWSVISRDETGVVFQWHYDVCGSLPEEDEVGRVILGKYSRYMLEYSARVHELAPETRALWMKTFAEATFDSVTLSLDSAWMSVDVDEPVPFSADKVMAALEAGMQAQNCKVSVKTAERIECKRARVTAFGSKEPDLGGESVTAELESHGSQTQVRITTGKGFYGRLSKKNWSTPMFEAMMRALQQPSQ
jgi:hypothetical protein